MKPRNVLNVDVPGNTIITQDLREHGTVRDAALGSVTSHKESRLN